MKEQGANKHLSHHGVLTGTTTGTGNFTVNGNYAQFIKCIGLPAYQCDIDGKVIYYNKESIELWGKRPLVGKDLWGAMVQVRDVKGDIVSTTALPMFIAAKQGRPQGPLELELVRTDGGVRKVIAHAIPTYNESGVVNGAVNMVIDVTPGPKQDGINEADSRLREVSDSMPGLMFQFKLETNGYMWFPFISEGSKALMGIDPQELYMKPLAGLELVHADDLEVLVTAIKSAAGQNGPFVVKFRIIEKETGSIKWIRVDSLSQVQADGSTLWNGTMIDITETKIATDELRITRRAIENAVEGIIITDATRTQAPIIFANSSFYKMTGYSPEDVIGNYCSMLHGPDTDPETVKLIDYKLEHKEIFSGEVLNYKKDGSSFWNEVTIVPIANEDGQVTHFAGFQNDVTLRKLAEEKLNTEHDSLEVKVQRRTAQLEDANRELEAFNYTVSHDLQTPLRSIAGFSKILLNDNNLKASAEAYEHLSFIESSAKQMTALIKSMLNFSKLGKASLNYSNVNFNQLVNKVVESIKINTPDFKAQVVIHPLTDVICDAELIKQVWANLIGNAVKYSARRAMPLIEIGTKEIDNDIVYYIKDNGAGFDMEKAGNLFAPFHRMHTSSEFEGTGVGLATVQRIIAKHGGRVWAEAKENEGAIFFFTLKGTIKQA